MGTEVRETEVETMTVAGFKLDKTFTIANLVQIVLLVIAGFGVWLNGYIERRDTRAMVIDLQDDVGELRVEFRDQLSEIKTEFRAQIVTLDTNFKAQMAALENNRSILIQKNEDRWATAQASINAHESRLNVNDASEQSIRERLSEMFDELRSINAYIRQMGYAGPQQEDR